MPISKQVKIIIGIINGFRKYSIMLILITIAVTFRLMNYLNGAEVVDLLSGVTIAFMASNSVEHAVKGVTDWLKAKDN